jgi:diaminopimelate decarboxylase
MPQSFEHRLYYRLEDLVAHFGTPFHIYDQLVIHDTGAHGHAMGFNYNGQLRPKELLIKSDGSVSLIRREERLDDYFATLTHAPDKLVWQEETIFDHLAN